MAGGFVTGGELPLQSGFFEGLQGRLSKPFRKSRPAAIPWVRVARAARDSCEFDRPAAMRSVVMTSTVYLDFAVAEGGKELMGACDLCQRL